MLKLFQFSAFAAVLFSNAHWQWTPNHYLAGLIGLGAVAVVTAVGVFIRRLRGARPALN
jgi:hypothetical protein